MATDVQAFMRILRITQPSSMPCEVPIPFPTVRSPGRAQQATSKWTSPHGHHNCAKAGHPYSCTSPAAAPASPRTSTRACVAPATVEPTPQPSRPPHRSPSATTPCCSPGEQADLGRDSSGRCTPSNPATTRPPCCSDSRTPPASRAWPELTTERCTSSPTSGATSRPPERGEGRRPGALCASPRPPRCGRTRAGRRPLGSGGVQTLRVTVAGVIRVR